MHRIPAVPRLRQRLIKLPLDCGRPVWIDDHEFDIDHHLRAVSCPSPGDERALLDTALSVIMEPLSRERPLWSVVQITDLADGASAVVFVLHHVFADGAGGLNILAALSDSDPGAPSAAPPFPQQSPSRPSLVRDAWQTRLQGVRRAAGLWRCLQRSMSAGGGFHAARATPCSLVEPTGPRRRLAVVHLDRARLAGAAHRHAAATNDAFSSLRQPRCTRYCRTEGRPSIPW